MKGVIFILLALILVVPLASAVVDTGITAAYLPGHSIMVNILNPDGDLLKSYENDTDSSGRVTFTYTSDSRMSINISVLVRKDGSLVKMKKYGGYTTGDIVSLDLLQNPATTTNTTNTTSTTTTTNTTNTTSTTTTTNTTTTTGSTGEKKESNFTSEIWNKTKNIASSYWYYVVIIIVIIVVIYFIIKAWPSIKSKMSSPATASTVVESRPKSRIESQLYEAEKRIKQAQAEINELRNRDAKVREAERKFAEAKRELERLKR